VVRGIDGDGRLLLDGLRGREAVVAGSVRLLESMGGGVSSPPAGPGGDERKGPAKRR